MRMPDLTRALTEPSSPTSVSARSRARRWDLLIDRFADLDRMRVLDLGGEPSNWRASPVRPREVVLLNIHPVDVGDDGGWLRSVAGNACDPPAELRGERFDLVYSNSTIEHVGGHAQRAGFAEAAHTLAPRHWVQTPYRYFPIEPHWLCPGFQFLPLRARTRLMKSWPFGNAHKAWKESGAQNGSAHREAVEQVLWIDLLSRTEMRHYFPDSELVDERVGGMTKSIIAVSDGV